MVKFKATIKKFAQNGDKTGWTYIDVPAAVAEKIKPSTRVGFRVKGKIETLEISFVSTIPMGGGNFIIPLNAGMRKILKRNVGEIVTAHLTEDTSEFVLNKEMLECLEDEPVGLQWFNSLNAAHQRYFSKWIDDAKTEPTKIKRLARVINALVRKMTYSDMLREKTI